MFAGKAAPGYEMAKLHIRLINDVAAVINGDPDVRGKLAVAFVPNYGVSLAQAIIPAADLSVQISTAGKEASGTSNMKFALNGALTLGTLDGANVEIRDAVGHENFFLFGLTAERGGRDARRAATTRASVIAAHPGLEEVLALIASGFFSLGDRDRYRPIVDSLRWHDPYMVCADFDAYVATRGARGRRLRRSRRVVATRAAQHHRRQPLLQRRHDPRVRQGDLGPRIGPHQPRAARAAAVVALRRRRGVRLRFQRGAAAPGPPPAGRGDDSSIRAPLERR